MNERKVTRCRRLHPGKSATLTLAAILVASMLTACGPPRIAVEGSEHDVDWWISLPF